MKVTGNIPIHAEKFGNLVQGDTFLYLSHSSWINTKIGPGSIFIKCERENYAVSLNSDVREFQDNDNVARVDLTVQWELMD